MSLGQPKTHQLVSGSNEISFKSDGIPIADISRRILNNVGAMEVSLSDTNGNPLSTLTLVVSIDDREGVFHRTVFSPFV